MAQVRRIIDNVLITVPFAFTHQGLNGTVVIDNFGEGDKIYFTYGISTDDVSDTNEVTTHISMGSFYSLDLIEADPEGIDPDDPEDPILEPTRTPAWNPTVSRTFIETGTYADETMIGLTMTNNPEGFEMEFSAYFHGSISGSPGSQSPLTWVTIPKDNDGKYYIIHPSNDDTPPTPQPFWVRFVGNTGTTFGNYITFRTDGTDPLDDPIEEGTDGGIGTELAVNGEEERGFDLVWTVWGGFSGRDLSSNDPVYSKTHLCEMSAISGSGRSDFKDQAPFYAYHTGNQTIGVPIDIVGDPFHVPEPRFANVDWQMTETDFRMCNEYLIRSGFQCWNFTYYSNGNQLAQMRQFWEGLTNLQRRGVTAFYSMHQIGGDRGSYRDGNGQIDPANGYTININHIVTKMGESWYKKIGGKPVIVYFDDSESAMATDAANLRAAYREEYSVSDQYPFYEIQMTFLADTNNVFVNQNNMRAKTWYYQTNNESQGSHSLESTLVDAYNNFVDMGQNAGNLSRDIAPSMNVALDGRARWEYPPRTACIDNITPGTASYNSGINWAAYNSNTPDKRYVDKSYSYYNAATSTDVTSIVNKFAALKSLFGSRMKLAFVSTWDENSEGGKSTGMPKLEADGTTINDDIIEFFRSHYNENYETPPAPPIP